MKINYNALIKRMKLEFESDIDLNIEEGEFYSYTENDLFPKLNDYKEQLNANKKITTVKIKRFIFTEQSLQIIKAIATKAKIVDQELFIKQLQRSVTSELARIKLQNVNRDLNHNNSSHKKQLNQFNNDSSRIINKLISMNTESLSHIVNNIQIGLPFIFDGKLNSFTEDDLLKFLHLLETSSQHYDEGIINYSRTKTPIMFIEAVLFSWEHLTQEPNARGMKALLNRLYAELYNSMNQPIPDLEHWLKEIKRLK